MPASQLPSSRLGSLACKGLTFAALFLAGPTIIHLLLANFSFLRADLRGGTCVFDLMLQYAAGNIGLVIFWIGPSIVLAAIIGAAAARRQGQEFYRSLRWLAAPGFGLLCALIVQAPGYFRLGNSQIAFTYAPITLPFIAFLTTYQPKWRAILDDPKWFRVVAGAIIVSYIAAWALVRPHVLNYLSCGAGG